MCSIFIRLDQQNKRPSFVSAFSGTIRSAIVLLTVLHCVVTFAPCASGQVADEKVAELAPPAMTEVISLEILQPRRKGVEENAGLEEAVKAVALEGLNGAIKALQEEKTFIDRLATLQTLTENVAAQTDPVRAELEAPTQEVEKPSSAVDLPMAQQRLTEFEEKLRVAEADKTNLDEQDATRTRRRTEAPAELSRARTELETLNAENTVVPEGLHPEVQYATRSLRTARRRSLVAKIAFLERELPAYDANASLLSAKRSLAARRVTVARRTVTTWQEFVNQQRLSEAEANAKEASEFAANVSAAASEPAKDVSELAAGLVSVRAKLAQDIARTNKKITAIEAETTRLKDEFEDIKARADAAGFTNSVGVLLRQHKTSLPDLRQQVRDIADRQVQIAETHIDRLNYQNQKSVVADVEDLSERKAGELGSRLSKNEQLKLRDELRVIYQAKGRYLDGVIADLSSYLERLATLDVSQRTYTQQTADQSGYIAEHILWVRSATSIDATTATQTIEALAELRSDSQEIVRHLFEDVRNQPQLWLLAAVIIFVLLFSRGRIRDQIMTAGKNAGRKITTELQPTLSALGMTLLISSVWPMVFLFLGWRLNSGQSTLFTSATGFAAQATAALVLTLDFLRHVCRPIGLGIAHFNWPSRTADAVRRCVRTVLFMAVPIAGLSLLLGRTQIDIYLASLGRLSLMAALGVLATAMHVALRPGSPIVEETAILSPRGWFIRTRYFWYAVGVGMPVILMILALTGYLYTARQLSMRLIETGWLLLIVVIVVCFLKRWQLLTYRSLAMKQARDRRATLISENEGATPGETFAAQISAEETVGKLSESNVRLGNLFNVVFATTVVIGVGFIWSDVLPAFGVLSNYQLWQSSVATETAAGVKEYDWITLWELGQAILLLTLTFFSATNIPALLEFAVLQRLPLDSGTRYAISTVVRYVITVFGVAFGCTLLGFGWANIQWLVAAMTVGLGFGLQEIFANFVSGLILLFERPIRIGDTVTVGDVTGTVTRIRIRATTIVDWDRKELVVPNREFVTGQLINWTLSDAVLRVIAQVGIAYGSDTRLATELLYQVAADNPNVLDEPLTKVMFNAFGSSSLDFELRCFVASPQHYRDISHDLNIAIDDLFRQHNIEIAFPQQDLHIRSVDFPIPFVSNRDT